MTRNISPHRRIHDPCFYAEGDYKGSYSLKYSTAVVDVTS